MVIKINNYQEKLKKYMQENNIQGEYFCFAQSCHSVAEAAQAAHAKPEDFVKNICMAGTNGNLIVAIVKGEDRASTSKVAEALKIQKPRTATPEEILEKTGYPCGGTPSFGYIATFLIDPEVMRMKFVYSGGGSENSLVKISTKELQKANGGQIVRVRK